MAKTIIFDFDGTIMNSEEGILHCAGKGLSHFGIPIPDRQTMLQFIGPPLYKTFIEFGVPEDQAETAVEVYREHYRAGGKYRAHPYAGIPELLKELCDAGHTLLIASVKPEELVVDIATHFGLASYFKRICGASFDSTRREKDEVIAYLLEQEEKQGQWLMVGDTAFDILGAAKFGIPGIGVSWGFGDVKQMHDAGAITVADSVADLKKRLLQDTEGK